jgi:phosphoglycolate phosphatase-like HAD superfamily hydrolase
MVRWSKNQMEKRSPKHCFCWADVPRISLRNYISIVQGSDQMQVFLDLDGPVLDVSARYYAIYSDLLKSADYLPFDQESYWSLKRLSIQEAAIVQRNMPDYCVQDYLEQRSRLLENPAYLICDRLHEGVVETLTSWSSEHRVHLVTLRRNRIALMSQLELLGIRDKFDQVFCAQGVEASWKTKCAWIRACCSSSEERVIVGDTEADVLAGRAASIRTVALSCGVRSRRLLQQLAPDQLLPSLREIDLDTLFERARRKETSHFVS